MKKNSLSEINVMTSILTLIIILIHTGAEGYNSFDKNTLIGILVFIFQKSFFFAIPGFIFLSSLKFFYKYEDNYSFTFKKYFSFIKIRFLKIIVPYIIISLLYYLFHNFLGEEKFNFKSLLLALLTGSMSYQLYFVIAIFQFYLLMPFFTHYFTKKNIKLVLITSFFINVIFRILSVEDLGIFGYKATYILNTYCNRLFLGYIFYWSVGAYVGIYYEKFKHYINISKSKIFVFFLIVFSIHITFFYLKEISVINYKSKEIFYLIYSMVAILLLYKLSMIITIKNISFVNSIFKNFSKSSYYIYLIHPFFITLINKYFFHINLDNLYLRYLIRTILTIFLSWSISSIFQSLKYRFSRFSKFIN